MSRVLIVEDNAAMLEEVAFNLEMRGYTVQTAESGRAALSILDASAELPDVIVSDIVMPDIDGYQLLEEIQQVEELAEIPFIFLTGEHDSQEDVRIGKQLGADDYLVKPFQVDDLVVAIENKLRRMRQWQERTRLRVEHVHDELLALVAHQLNAPNAGGHQLLLEDLESLPDEFSQKALHAIQQETGRINRFIEQIVLLIRADNGQLETEYVQERQAYQVSMLIESACYVIENEFRDYPLNIQTGSLSPTLSVVGVYQVMLTSISEVVRNAVLFSAPGSRIDIRARKDGNFVLIEVEDEGCGIESDYLPYVWERFTRFHNTSLIQQGIGLGLSIVRDSMRVHQGEVALNSIPGKGTLVSMKFPFAP